MQVHANGIRLEVEDHGPRNGEPLVLIMGLGMQLVAWHEGFVQLLVDRGLRVIRFDNRDIGLSDGFDHLGVPNLALAAMKHALGVPVRSPYALADMADDTAGCSMRWASGRAHVCGALDGRHGGAAARGYAMRRGCAAHADDGRPAARPACPAVAARA
jgi:pimeloyl-ACP methyl ester carboxylesterase